MERIAMPLGSLIVASALLVATLSIASAADTMEKDTNRPGGDYKNFEVNGGAGDCERACDRERVVEGRTGLRGRCKAWTWVRKGVQGPAAHCWLKDSVPPPVPDKNCWSGTMGKSQILD